MVLDAAEIDPSLMSGSTYAVTNSAITNAILPLQNADIPSAGSLTNDMNYQLNRSSTGVNSWQPITTAASALGDLTCLLYTSPSPRDRQKSRMPSSA